MTELQRPIIILNLAGELSPELTRYFSERKINVILPEDLNSQIEVTHLFTKNVKNFNELKKQYQTLSKK